MNARLKALAAAPDAAIVWVAARTQGGGGLLARIDTGTNQVDPTVRLRHAPTGLTVTPTAGQSGRPPAATESSTG